MGCACAGTTGCASAVAVAAGGGGAGAASSSMALARLGNDASSHTLRLQALLEKRAIFEMPRRRKRTRREDASEAHAAAAANHDQDDAAALPVVPHPEHAGAVREFAMLTSASAAGAALGEDSDGDGRRVRPCHCLSRGCEGHVVGKSTFYRHAEEDARRSHAGDNAADERGVSPSLLADEQGEIPQSAAVYTPEPQAASMPTSPAPPEFLPPTPPMVNPDGIATRSTVADEELAEFLPSSADDYVEFQPTPPLSAVSAEEELPLRILELVLDARLSREVCYTPKLSYSRKKKEHRPACRSCQLCTQQRPRLTAKGRRSRKVRGRTYMHRRRVLAVPQVRRAEASCERERCAADVAVQCSAPPTPPRHVSNVQGQGAR